MVIRYAGAPDSQIVVQSSMQRARKADLEDSQCQSQINNDVSIIKEALKLRFRSPIQLEFPEISLEYNEIKYFKENIQINLDTALELAVATIGQQNELWHLARRRRITGSRCYSLYTYCSNKHPDWAKKIKDYLCPSFKGNTYTEYGKKYEEAAKIRYQDQHGTIYETGVLINPVFPWMALVQMA